MKLKLARYLACICCLFLSSGWATAQHQSVKTEPAKDLNWTHIYVSTKGSDTNPGTLNKPLRRVSKALAELKTIDGPVVIKIEPGVYREGNLRIGRRAWPTVIESSGEQQAVISGSDVWSEWESVGPDWVAAWPYDWGLYQLDASFPQRDHDSLTVAGQRSEMVFVDGLRQVQVTERSDLRPGTFFIDLAVQQIRLRLPDGTQKDTALIEVGMRPNLLAALQPKDLTLRRLTFQHAVSHTTRKDKGFETWGVCIFGEHVSGISNDASKPDRVFAENILLEDCRFIQNNRYGLTVANTKRFKAIRCQFSDNGVMGFNANRNRYVHIEDSQFDRNNWRLGFLGHVIGWHPAGTKMLFMSDMDIVRSTFRDNFATGLWLDTSVNHVRILDSVIEGNWGTGFYYEHSQGPALLKNSLVRRNGFNDGSRTIRGFDGGVLFAESEHLTIESSRIEENINFQIGARPRPRAGGCYWTNRHIDGSCRHLTLLNSTIVGTYFDGPNVPEYYNAREHRHSTLVGMSQHGISDMYAADFPTTFRGSGNTYVYSDQNVTFSTGPNWGYQRISLSAWQDLTAQDKDSVFVTE
ncbi:MAG: right-handed parallel beta-helix repeat-containing protein [Planctomycetota bacterium]